MQDAQSRDALLDLLHHSPVGWCINSAEAPLELGLGHEFGQIRPNGIKSESLSPAQPDVEAVAPKLRLPRPSRQISYLRGRRQYR